jgi:hypothetical protein
MTHNPGHEPKRHGMSLEEDGMTELIEGPGSRLY